MHFLTDSQVKWYDWFWLIPFFILIALPYSLIATLYTKILACFRKKK
ncbi:hypothetical protein QTG56_24060 (plasmid) [Rossellomorea sp. AcN35-11]|nr:hypothetical protein [Rossellomorea aquimaris]WJV31714.1 hypothetical protein QTG56_24060 [Rossellomorea sp. AcN35-11]